MRVYKRRKGKKYKRKPLSLNWIGPSISLAPSTDLKEIHSALNLHINDIQVSFWCDYVIILMTPPFPCDHVRLFWPTNPFSDIKILEQLLKHVLFIWRYSTNTFLIATKSINLYPHTWDTSSCFRWEFQ